MVLQSVRACGNFSTSPFIACLVGRVAQLCRSFFRSADERLNPVGHVVEHVVFGQGELGHMALALARLPAGWDLDGHLGTVGLLDDNGLIHDGGQQ